MIVPPTSVRVLVATRPVDFRKGMDGLAALVPEELKADPFSGVIYVFRAKRADRVKLLFWDGTGVCLPAKRLEGSKFRWPSCRLCSRGSIGRACTRAVSLGSQRRNDPHVRLIVTWSAASQISDNAAMALSLDELPAGAIAPCAISHSPSRSYCRSGPASCRSTTPPWDGRCVLQPLFRLPTRNVSSGKRRHYLVDMERVERNGTGRFVVLRDILFELSFGASSRSVSDNPHCGAVLPSPQV